MNYENPEKRLALLQKEVLDPNSEIFLENLLDLAVSVIYDIHSSGTWKNSKPIKSFLDRYPNFSEKIYKYRLSTSDFQVVKTIGQGGFGRVDLVKHKVTNNVYAMKVIEKSTYIQNAFNGFWEERDILTQNESDWLVKCFYTFMDLKKLYIVMEYMPGGNLLHWLLGCEEFNSEQTHFYAMEMILAIETIHNMQFLHRDLKPDNMLLDINGHLKLADFGTCIKVEQGKVKTNFQVGTPDYIAPEVLSKAGVHDLEVGFEIDWWAFGIVVYELFYGETPFEGESTVTLYKNIMMYKTTLCYPDDKPSTDGLVDFLKGLLTEPTSRMDISRVKSHPYMTKGPYSWNFANIRQHHTPLIFDVKDEADTQHILYDPTEKRGDISSGFVKQNFFSGENLAFTGFSFNRFRTYAISDSSAKGDGNYKMSELEQKLSEIELSKQKLTVKLDQNMAELSQIQNKLINKEKELLEKEQTIIAKNSEQTQILEANKQLKVKIETLTKECELSKRNIDQLKVSINEKEALIKAAKEELLTTSENNSILKKDLKQVEQKLQTVNRDLEEKGVQLERLSKIENILEDERNRTKDLTAHVNTKNRKIIEYEKQMELLNDRINDLNSKNNKISLEKINSNEQMEELSALKGKFDKLQREKESVDSNFNLSTVELQEIKNDRDLLRSELRTEVLKKTALEKTRDKLSKDLSEKTSQFNTLQNKLHETEDQMKILKQKLNINESEKEQLESQCKMYESMAIVKRIEFEEAKTEFEELLEVAEKNVSILETERSSLTERLMLLTEELGQLRAECDEQKSRLEDLDELKNDRNDLKKKIIDLKDELENKSLEIETLFENNKTLKFDLNRSNTQVSEYKVKVDALVNKIDYLIKNPTDVHILTKKRTIVSKDSDKKLRQLENDIQKYLKNINSNQMEIIELRNECQNWREKYNELEQENEKNLNIINQLKAKVNDNGATLTNDEELDKQTVLSMELCGKVEILSKKGKGRHKITFVPVFAVLKAFQISFYQNESDATPMLTIHLRDVQHIKETTQADCVHVDKNFIPLMLQIIYYKPDTEDSRRLSVMPQQDVTRRSKVSLLVSDDQNASMRASNPNLSGIINIENHSYVHTRYRGPQICDICHESCSDMFSPPIVLECSKCKQRIHQTHINDKRIRACTEAIENYSIKLESQEVRKSWLKQLNLLRQYQKSDEIKVGPSTYYRSFHVPGARHSPVNNPGTASDV